MLAERHLEIEPVVNAVAVHLADVVIDAAGAQHRAGDARVDRQFARQHADALRARHDDFVLVEQRVEFVEEGGEIVDDLLRLLEPVRAARRMRQPPNRMKLHIIRAPLIASKRSSIFSRSRKAYMSGVPMAPMSCRRNPHKRGVILQARQLRQDYAEIFRAFRHLQPGQLFNRQA